MIAVATPVVVRMDVSPVVPSGMVLHLHHHVGPFTWDPTKVELFVTPSQEGGMLGLGGIDIVRRELMVAQKNPFNANLLDFLLGSQYEIPEEWKRGRVENNLRRIFFLDTTFRDPRSDYLYLTCMWTTRATGAWKRGVFQKILIDFGPNDAIACQVP